MYDKETKTNTKNQWLAEIKHQTKNNILKTSFSLSAP